MKKEELKALGLSEEQIAEVFKQNGIDVENAKKSAKADMQTTIDGLNNQLKTAEDGLKKFDGIDPEKLSGEIQTLNAQLATQKADFEKQIADRDFNDLLNTAILGAKGKDSKAVAALLDLDTLKASKNQKEDIGSAIDALKKDKAYLFDSDEPINNPTTRTDDGRGTSPALNVKMNAARAVMGLPPLKEN